MFKLTSFRDLCKRPLLEAAVLEVEPESPDAENKTFKAVVPHRGRGRQKKTTDEKYLADLPEDADIELIPNWNKVLKVANDVPQAKGIILQSVLASLGLIDRTILSKTQVTLKGNQVKINKIKQSFENFITKYRFDKDADAEQLKKLFSPQYSKAAVSDAIGFNIYDLFNVKKDWENDIFAVSKKFGMTKIGLQVLRTYSGMYGLDQSVGEKYEKMVGDVYAGLTNKSLLYSDNLKYDEDPDTFNNDINDDEDDDLETAEEKRLQREKDNKRHQEMAKKLARNARAYKKTNPADETTDVDVDFEKPTSKEDEIYSYLAQNYNLPYNSAEEFKKKTGSKIRKITRHAELKSKDPNDLTEAEADELSELDDDAKKPLSPEEEAALLTKIYEKYDKAIDILFELISIAEHVFIAVDKENTEEDTVTVKQVTPHQFNKFLDAADSLNGMLRSFGLLDSLEYKEDIDPSETIIDYLTRINSMLDEVTIASSKKENTLTIIGNQAARALNHLVKKFERAGYTGGLTIENIIKYINSDIDPANYYTRKSLEYNYGITPDELTIENFPTFRSFITTLYHRGKFFHEWAEQARKRNYKFADESEKIGGLGQAIKQGTEQSEQLKAKKERYDQYVTAAREDAKFRTNEKLLKWANNELAEDIQVSAAAGLTKNIALSLGIELSKIVFVFPNVTKKEFDQIRKEEKNKPDGFLKYATDSFKDTYKEILSKEDGQSFVLLVNRQLGENISQRAGRITSRTKHAAKLKSKQSEATSGKIDKTDARIVAAEKEKYGYARSERITGDVADSIRTGKPLEGETLEDETADTGEGYFSYDISTNDGELLRKLKASLLDFLFTIAPTAEVSFVNQITSIKNLVKEVNERIQNWANEVKEKANTVIPNETIIAQFRNALRRKMSRIAYGEGNTIMITFPKDSTIAKSNKIEKIVNTIGEFINEQANKLANELDNEQKRINFGINGIYSDILKNKGQRVTTKNSRTFIDDATDEEKDKQVINMLTSLSQQKKSKNQTAGKILKQAGRSTSGKVTLGDLAAAYGQKQINDEDEEIMESLEALNTFAKFNNKVKLIPNKERFKRGYLIQERKYDYLSR